MDRELKAFQEFQDGLSLRRILAFGEGLRISRQVDEDVDDKE
jgi:hypothetical protein